MSNHIHTILRNRPDVVAKWTDEEVAIRCLSVFLGNAWKSCIWRSQPKYQSIRWPTIPRDKKIRRRLSDISWFMRALAEPIARMANKEDECTGRFWKDALRLNASPTKQACWPVRCMST